MSSMCKDSANLPDPEFLHVGGMTVAGMSTDAWYWVTSGEKISYNIKWKPGEPNFLNMEYCLSIGNSEYLYNDIDCYMNSKKFICQSIKTYTSDNVIT